MSKVCESCGKRPTFGFNVSHSHRKTKRRWNPNIQTVRIEDSGGSRKMRVCARCLKTFRKSGNAI